jgi:hypothetical protein
MASRSKNPTPPATRPAAPRAARPAAPADRMTANGAGRARPGPTDEEIRARAYALWEQAGRPEGDGLPFWLQAERELTGRI